MTEECSSLTKKSQGLPPDMPAARVALVTGGNRGLGQEIARQLAAQGVTVLAGTRDAGVIAPKVLPHAQQEGAVVSVYLDVAEIRSVEAAVDYAIAHFGSVDILVNNAGISDGDQEAASAEFHLVEKVINVNVICAWRVASVVIPHMRERGFGRIVNMSSTLGSLSRMTSSSEPAYRVSKAALNAVTRILAAELDGTGILVNSASPGWVRTDLGGPRAPRSVEQGADTPVWLATLPDDGPTGGFFYEHTPLEW
jgi:NAD(P)-dependent dehydrogenase (short-subunit alcohol dehydrogenase family)